MVWCLIRSTSSSLRQRTVLEVLSLKKSYFVSYLVICLQIKNLPICSRFSTTYCMHTDTTGLQSSTTVMELNGSITVTCTFAIGASSTGCQVTILIMDSLQEVLSRNITRPDGANEVYMTIGSSFLVPYLISGCIQSVDWTGGLD